MREDQSSLKPGGSVPEESAIADNKTPPAVELTADALIEVKVTPEESDRAQE